MTVPGSTGVLVRTAVDRAKIARILAAFEVRVQMGTSWCHPALHEEATDRSDEIVRAFKDFAVEIGVRFTPSRRIGFPADVDLMPMWSSSNSFAKELHQELACEGVTWGAAVHLSLDLLVLIYSWDQLEEGNFDRNHHSCLDNEEDRYTSARAQLGWVDGEVRRQAARDERDRRARNRERGMDRQAKARLDTNRRRNRQGRVDREHNNLEF
jgi:hypothetical protein